jgi:PHD/YefM family antitoxin component YafN of YafNO toxin-antitoxin module
MASEGSAVRSVEDVRRDVAGVLSRFRRGRGMAFSFGDGGVPEAVLLTYDQFEDLGGESKFERRPGVVAAEVVGAELAEMVAAIRDGSFAPVVWGDGGEPEAVIMSTSQYRQLRGDDEPPPGTIDDPTRRVYASEPLPTSRAMTLDEIAAMMGPYTQQVLEEIRQEKREEAEGARREDDSR